MTQPNTSGPFAIIGGRMYPITAQQYALNRAGKPTGPIAGYNAPQPAFPPHPPATPSTAASSKAASPDGRALSRASMEKLIRSRGEEPKSSNAHAPIARKTQIDRPARARERSTLLQGVPTGADARAVSKASMLHELKGRDFSTFEY